MEKNVLGDEAEHIRQRNAAYSRRSYYRKREKFNDLRDQAMLLQEHNFNLKQEEQRLTGLLLKAQQQVANLATTRLLTLQTNPSPFPPQFSTNPFVIDRALSDGITPSMGHSLQAYLISQHQQEQQRIALRHLLESRLPGSYLLNSMGVRGHLPSQATVFSNQPSGLFDQRLQSNANTMYNAQALLLQSMAQPRASTGADFPLHNSTPDSSPPPKRTRRSSGSGF